MFTKIEAGARYVASPEKMQVGQICVRTIKSKNAMNALRGRINKAIYKGMEFSHELNGDQYSIRRDK